ncbi:MAG TPA: hypothetical protein VFZ19_12355 [Solirubrobacterales bacterium]
MRERERQLREIKAVKETSPAGRVIDRLEREIQPGSDRSFNVGLLIVGIAASAVIAIPTVASPVIQAALGTLAFCLFGSAIICFIAGARDQPRSPIDALNRHRERARNLGITVRSSFLARQQSRRVGRTGVVHGRRQQKDPPSRV